MFRWESQPNLQCSITVPSSQLKLQLVTPFMQATKRVMTKKTNTNTRTASMRKGGRQLLQPALRGYSLPAASIIVSVAGKFTIRVCFLPWAILAYMQCYLCRDCLGDTRLGAVDYYPPVINTELRSLSHTQKDKNDSTARYEHHKSDTQINYGVYLP